MPNRIAATVVTCIMMSIRWCLTIRPVGTHRHFHCVDLSCFSKVRSIIKAMGPKLGDGPSEAYVSCIYLYGFFSENRLFCRQLQKGFINITNISTSVPSPAHPDPIQIKTTIKAKGDPGYLLAPCASFDHLNQNNGNSMVNGYGPRRYGSRSRPLDPAIQKRSARVGETRRCVDTNDRNGRCAR